MPLGQGVFKWATGESYLGNFALGKRTSTGTNYYPDGATYEGKWKNDKRNG